ncbi:hypothetical protein [Streptomyces sp. NPDC048309]|uniref:hypothetical protein n=1 Tax=unclassified Streptomyces TaxID=2593676 RepID=UPI0033E2E843
MPEFHPHGRVSERVVDGRRRGQGLRFPEKTHDVETYILEMYDLKRTSMAKSGA